MTSVSLKQETYLPDGDVARVHDFLAAQQAAGEQPPVFLGAQAGGQVELPPATFQVLRQVVEAMHRGLAVTVVPQSATLTTQQCADLLGVSRPTVIKLLEGGAIPFEWAGHRRRVLLHDVLTYREQRRAQQYTVLEALAAQNPAGEDGDPLVELEQLRAERKVVAARRRSTTGG